MKSKTEIVCLLACWAALGAKDAVHAQPTSLNVEEVLPLPGLPEELADQLRSSIGDSKASPETFGNDPLAHAVGLVVCAGGDPDRVDGYKMRVVEALIQSRRLSEATELLEGMEGFRQSLGWLSMVDAISERSNGDGTPLAASALGAEELLLTVRNQLQQHKPWQQDLVLARLVMCGLPHGGNKDWSTDRKADLDAIQDAETRLGTEIWTLARSAGVGSGFELDVATTKLASISGPVATLRWAIEELIEKAVSATTAGRAKEAVEMAEAALALSQRSGVFLADLMLDGSAQISAAGDRNLGQKVLVQSGATLSGQTEIAGLMAYRWVRAMVELDRAPETTDELATVEAEARQFRQMDQPVALSWIGAAWDLIGEAEKSQACMDEAARAAETNVNPRMRYLGCVDVCLTHDEAKVALSAEVVSRLDRVRLGRPEGVVEVNLPYQIIESNVSDSSR